METNVNYTVVGAFVIALIMLIIIVIVWLSTGFSFQRYSVYRIFMSEAVSGLALNGPVEFNGVNVGRVNSIKIDKKNPKLVELLISIKSDTPVTRGTRAKLDFKALSGIANIALIDRGEDLRPVSLYSKQGYPVIPTSPSIYVRLDTTLKQLTTAFQQISSSFKQISTSVNALLDKENLHSIKETLINLRQATKELSPFLTNGKNALHLIEKETIPATNQAMHSFESLGNNLTNTSTEIMENPAIIIRGKQPHELGPGEQ